MNNWNIPNIRKAVEQSKVLTLDEMALIYGITKKQMTYLLNKKFPLKLGAYERRLSSRQNS